MKKIASMLLGLDYVISGLAYIALLGVTFIGVIMRYLISKPIIWQEEAQLFLIVWVVYFGISAAMRTRSHVAIELVVDALPRIPRRIIEFLGQVVVIVVLAYTAIRGISYVEQMMNTHRMTNILKVPYSAIYAALPISCILTIINQVVLMVQDAKADQIKPRGGEGDA